MKLSRSQDTETDVDTAGCTQRALGQRSRRACFPVRVPVGAERQHSSSGAMDWEYKNVQMLEFLS